MAQESNGQDNARYWRYLPFRRTDMQTLAQMLSD
jgi:hypothetical protein